MTRRFSTQAALAGSKTHWALDDVEVSRDEPFPLGSHSTSADRSCQKTRWVQWKNPEYPALLGGISALSRRTMLASDRLPTYALGPKILESRLERGTLIGCHDEEHATARIEVWSYEPKLLGDKESVDPLSLYLSLRYSADERVQQQLELLMQEVKWKDGEPKE